MMYRVCEHCGCSLDPGEKCDCLEKEAEEADANGSAGEQEEQKARCA